MAASAWTPPNLRGHSTYITVFSVELILPFLCNQISCLTSQPFNTETPYQLKTNKTGFKYYLLEAQEQLVKTEDAE